MNLPAHGTASPDPSIIVSLTKPHTKCKYNSVSAWPGPHSRQAKLFQTAWRYPLPARRQRPPDLTVFSSPPGGAHRAARRLLSADPLAKAIAWRLSVDRQAPYQKHSAAGFGTQFS